MKYKIVKDLNVQAVEHHINQHLKEGWKLYGNLIRYDSVYQQPMIKTDEVEEEEPYWISHCEGCGEEFENPINANKSAPYCGNCLEHSGW